MNAGEGHGERAEGRGNKGVQEEKRGEWGGEGMKREKKRRGEKGKREGDGRGKEDE